MPTSYCFLSTYPPTQCGLATFTAALRRALVAAGSTDRAHVVRIVDSKITPDRPEVVAHLRTHAHGGQPDAAETVRAAAAALNSHDVAIVQHEYGVYGGPDGDQVLAVLDLVRVPVLVVAHTVLTRPTPHQRAVLEQVVAAAAAVVTMTQTARTRLVAGYDVDATKINVIAHGAVERPSHHPLGGVRRPTILTWGLLGPGKGIEWGLIGLREIRRMLPQPRYVIAGETHPRVREQQGEAYRLGLGTRARALGVADLVRFERGYLDDATLSRMIERADVVLLPYDSHEQVTSGVLIEAVAAHKPVVSTAFPHAVELLSGGAGLLVPHRDGPAIGAALRRVLTDPRLAARMSAEAARIAPGLAWSTVADRYRTLAATLLASRTVVGG
ncbi:MAG: polysaccharide biosynthesis protein PslF [Micromonosporaceae bacterium]|nr:polysaccharide biosynthesis protein PslF [Micromonosporaceae bacterium]MDT5038706.1 polysaccharide biosynthesis protein PslF [Micromonosporaceae bacterium]